MPNDDSTADPCDFCDGSGVRNYTDDFGDHEIACADCNGTGEYRQPGGEQGDDEAEIPIVGLGFEEDY